MSVEREEIPRVGFFDAKNAHSYWYPKIDKLDVPTLDSTPIEITRNEEGEPEWDSEKAQDIVNELGGEAFIRSDYKSASHSLEEGSHIRNPTVKEVDRTIGELLFQHVMMDMHTGGVIWFRDWLDLDFCKYSQGSLHPEARVFVRDGNVICYHPRLSHDFDSAPDQHRETAIQDIEYAYPTDIDGDWRDHDGLETYAKRVASELDGWWSVDFVMTTSGEWYLTDMAVDGVYDLGERWGDREGLCGLCEHPGDCEFDVENYL